MLTQEEKERRGRRYSFAKALINGMAQHPKWATAHPSEFADVATRYADAVLARLDDAALVSKAPAVLDLPPVQRQARFLVDAARLVAAGSLSLSDLARYERDFLRAVGL